MEYSFADGFAVLKALASTTFVGRQRENELPGDKSQTITTKSSLSSGTHKTFAAAIVEFEGYVKKSCKRVFFRESFSSEQMNKKVSLQIIPCPVN